MNSEEKKVGMSFLNWLLSIIGIIILSLIIVLPPIFRIYFPAKEEEEFNSDVVVEVMKCSIVGKQVDAHSDDIDVTFRYIQDQIRTYTKHTVKTYHNIDSYEEDKQSLGRVSSVYSFVSGVEEYSLVPDNVNMKITISEKYDLGLFTNTNVNIPGSDESVSVVSEWSLSDSLNKIRSDLVSDGWTCENVSD